MLMVLALAFLLVLLALAMVFFFTGVSSGVCVGGAAVFVGVVIDVCV